jgi:hypothetical protein
MKTESYNQRLKYKGNFTKDEVWIDMMRTPREVGNIQLQNVFGLINNPLPGGILKVKFYIYKRKPSWIECNGKRIEFVYNLYRKLKDSENDHYELRFDLIPLKKESDIIRIPVSQDCYPKKTFIKYLLNELVQSNGDA